MANPGTCGSKRQIGALGAARDAAGFDNMPKQAEIGEIETHRKLRD